MDDSEHIIVKRLEMFGLHIDQMKNNNRQLSLHYRNFINPQLIEQTCKILLPSIVNI